MVDGMGNVSEKESPGRRGLSASPWWIPDHLWLRNSLNHEQTRPGSLACVIWR